MKRNPTIPKNEKYQFAIYKCWPMLFWYECAKCNSEFRREWGWRYLSGPFFGGRGQWKYLCKDCAPSLVEANRFANSYPKRPKAPPPPPQPTKLKQ